MTPFGVVGASGRMGRALVNAIAEAPGAILAAATEVPGSDAIGLDPGTLAGTAATGIAISDDPSTFANCAAVLDFTAPAASTTLASQLADLGVAHVIGTTGFAHDQDEAIAAAAKRVAIVKSGNMSLGVNLLAALVRQAAKALPQADLEILEMHHRHKVDAPSGTALLLGHAAAEGRGIPLLENAVMSREGQTGARPEGTIGFATLRGGSVVGEHDVILALEGERITLSHEALDRMVFARGGLAAGLWVAGKPAGHYTMNDVLGLTA